MKTITVKNYDEVPKDFTGVAKYNGITAWFQDGKLHRENGPAVIWADGFEQFFINNKKVKD